MLGKLTPVGPGAPPTPLWEAAWARGVSREALRAHLGDPTFVETDSRRTFGGEEDWWGYRNLDGTEIAVCLRVPYEDAIVCVSDLSRVAVGEGAALLAPWTVDVFEEPRRL